MTLIAFLISKIAFVSGIAIVAEFVRRYLRNVELAFTVWLMVLVVLLVPPVVVIPIPGWISSHLESICCDWFEFHSASMEPKFHASGDAAVRAAVAQNLLPVALIVWSVSGGFVLWRHARHARLVERLVRYSHSASPAVLQQCADIASELRFRTRPGVISAVGTFSPFLWHPLCGRPCVVFPARLLEQLSPVSVGAILRHELVHLRRGDAWRHRVELLVLMLWWWLPLSWIARRRLRELEELCADAEVLRSNPQGAKAYGHALLDADEFLGCSRSSQLACVSAFTTPGSLKTRIAAIAAFNPRHPTSQCSRATYGLIAVAAGLGLLVTGFGQNRPRGMREAQTARVAEGRQVIVVRSDQFDQWGADRQKLENAGLPDNASVLVRRGDNEIVLNWAGEPPMDTPHVIRLVKVSAADVWPPLWRIDGYYLGPSGNRERLDRRKLEWVFAHIGIDNVVFAEHRTRHDHPIEPGVSAARNEEERCLDKVAV